MKNIKTIGHSSVDGQEIMSQFKNNGADHFEKKPTSFIKMQNILE